MELLLFGLGGTGHAGQLVVHAEVVLEGDRRHRHVLAPDPDAFLGLDRLVQPFAVPAADHHAAGELVDDDHFAVADDVILVAVEDGVRLERLFQVMRQFDISIVVDALARRNPGQLLDLVDALVGQRDALVLEIDFVVRSWRSCLTIWANW